MHRIVSDIVGMKDFCNYFSSEAERTSRIVCFLCVMPWDHLLTARPVIDLWPGSVGLSRFEHQLSVSRDRCVATCDMHRIGRCVTRQMPGHLWHNLALSDWAGSNTNSLRHETDARPLVTCVTRQMRGHLWHASRDRCVAPCDITWHCLTERVRTPIPCVTRQKSGRLWHASRDRCVATCDMRHETDVWPLVT